MLYEVLVEGEAGELSICARSLKVSSVSQEDRLGSWRCVHEEEIGELEMLYTRRRLGSWRCCMKCSLKGRPRSGVYEEEIGELEMFNRLEGSYNGC
nr:hypothetical protein Iba_chr07eCG6980 [Ipomoea batatas]